MKNIIVLNIKNKGNAIHITNLQKLKRKLTRGLKIIAHLNIPRYKRPHLKKLQEKIFPLYVSIVFQEVPQLKKLVIIKWGPPHKRALPMLRENIPYKKILLNIIGTD